jgi:hypothetical protein
MNKQNEGTVDQADLARACILSMTMCSATGTSQSTGGATSDKAKMVLTQFLQKHECRWHGERAVMNLT